MNTTKLPALFLLSLLAVAGVASATAPTFPNVYASENPTKATVGFHDGSRLTVEAVRDFNVSADVLVNAHATQTLPTGYSVAYFFKAGTGAYTQVAANVTTTKTSTDFQALSGKNTWKAVVTIPTARQLNNEVELAFVIAMNLTAEQAGSGGTQNPSFGHRLVIKYVDPDQTGSNTDTVYGSSGGKIHVTDVEIGWAVTGIILFVVIWIVSMIVVHSLVKEKRFEHQLAIAAGSILLAFTVVALSSKLEPSGSMAFWRYAGLVWQQYVIFALAVLAVLVATGVAIMKLPRKKDTHILVVAGVTIAILSAAGYVLFFWFHIPIPFANW